MGLIRRKFVKLFPSFSILALALCPAPTSALPIIKNNKAKSQLSRVVSNPLGASERRRQTIRPDETVDAPYQLTQKSIKETVHRLVGDDSHAFLGFTPTIALTSSPAPNAFSRFPSRVVISTGLSSLLTSQDEFAFVLAHEIAHLMLHTRAPHHAPHPLMGYSSEASLQVEIEADIQAVKFLAAAGFNPEAALSVLTKLGQFGEDHGLAFSTLYPSLEGRRVHLEQYFTDFDDDQLKE